MIDWPWTQAGPFD